MAKGGETPTVSETRRGYPGREMKVLQEVSDVRGKALSVSRFLIKK
jgi:hypothetical protein